MRRLTVVAALVLGACGGGDNGRDAPPPAPDVASNFSQPLDARGADPQWGLKIRGGQLTLDRPNQPDLVATAPGAVISAHTASWTGKLPDGRSMRVSLYASLCSDGAGDLRYPFSAEVLLPDAAPLSGCAGAPASGARVATVAKR
jgi:uncharacterized membrane protein